MQLLSASQRLRGNEKPRPVRLIRNSQPRVIFRTMSRELLRSSEASIPPVRLSAFSAPSLSCCHGTQRNSCKAQEPHRILLLPMGGFAGAGRTAAEAGDGDKAVRECRSRLLLCRRLDEHFSCCQTRGLVGVWSGTLSIVRQKTRQLKMQ